jgi:hypothetical protein
MHNMILCNILSHSQWQAANLRYQKSSDSSE